VVLLTGLQEILLQLACKLDRPWTTARCVVHIPSVGGEAVINHTAQLYRKPSSAFVKTSVC